MAEERKKTEFKISGMTCATCVKTIENALKRLDGIVSVIVNLGAEKAYVTYNPKMTTVADMKKAIEEAGYQYPGVEGEETEDLEDLISKCKTLGIGILCVNVNEKGSV